MNRIRVPLAVDARGPFLRHALTSGPDLVKVNSSEATEVVGERGSPVAVATELRRVAGGDRHAVVVTLGAEGAVAIDEEGTTLRATLEARGRYPVGSGDAFLGGLVAELDGGGTLRVALASALGAGAANAELPGAGRLERERARALAARARVEMI